MSTIPADIAAEKAIWLSVAQGIEAKEPILEDLRKAGLRREWFTNKYIRVAIEGAMRLHLQGKEVSLLALMSHCNSDIGKAGWDSLSTAWIDAKAQERINWRQYVAPLKEFALLREVDGVLLDLKEQRNQAPHEVSRWLPHFVQRFRTALENGHDYDPTPSVIWAEGVPTKVVASTGSKTLDKALGGGLRNVMVGLWVAPTGMGKSRLTYTLAANSVGQRHRVAVISTEASPFDVVAGVLQAYGGFTT